MKSFSQEKVLVHI